jgi:hypothetical protein
MIITLCAAARNHLTFELGLSQRFASEPLIKRQRSSLFVIIQARRPGPSVLQHVIEHPYGDTLPPYLGWIDDGELCLISDRAITFPIRRRGDEMRQCRFLGTRALCIV